MTGNNNPNYKHGLSSHPLYSIWTGMKTRCFNKKEKKYKNYGGRGITVCIEWLDFKAFYDWAISNGWKKCLTLDRRENNGNYEPGNCRFINTMMQNRNRRPRGKAGANGITTTKYGAFKVHIGVNGEKIYLGVAKTVEEGVKLRTDYIKKRRLKNFN